MQTRFPAVILLLLAAAFAGCVEQEAPPVQDTQTSAKRLRAPGIVVYVAEQVRSNVKLSILPSVSPGHGLYEPTIDVSDDGTVYYSAHSQDVGRNPSPAYYTQDNGETWFSMAL